MDNSLVSLYIIFGVNHYPMVDTLDDFQLTQLHQLLIWCTLLGVNSQYSKYGKYIDYNCTTKPNI